MLHRQGFSEDLCGKETKKVSFYDFIKTDFTKKLSKLLTINQVC
jgi:hypothetical protein